MGEFLPQTFMGNWLLISGRYAMFATRRCRSVADHADAKDSWSYIRRFFELSNLSVQM
jgi:hypothetical protein